MSKFTHLHTHSHYSLLTALPKVPELVAYAKKNGMSALALTDDANLYGAIEFYRECKDAGIKPIIGIDAFVALRTRHDKQAGVDNKRHRLVLLAEDNTGYKNLMKLSTDANLEGFYYKPRVDHELLEKYHEGLIAILPCFSGEVSDKLRTDDTEGAAQILSRYVEIFGEDNVFLEITRHPEDEGHQKLVEKVIKLAQKEEANIVAAHEIYYLEEEDRQARETLLAIQSSSHLRQRDEEVDLSFIPQKEMVKRFSDLPEALENTEKIAERCNIEIELGGAYFPDIKISENTTFEEELRRQTEAGFEKRGLEKTKEILKRMEYELGIINDKGYPSYFLVVADLIRFANKNGIPSNIRGSVSGSLVTYLLGITNLNPLEYGLRFERFLNPERPSLPDIDMDFADNRRDEVIEYAREKYGGDKVAQIGTFGTMMARGAVRDVARALGYPYALGDRIAKLIPFGQQGFPMTIERALEMEPDLRKIYDEEPEVQEVIDMAQKIEGCARHISVHAAGVVIAPTDLTNFTPLQLDPRGGKLTTQYDMHAVEDAGLPKFDFLGLKNLSILADTLKRLKWRHGIEMTLDNVPVDDEKTFEMLSRGETMGLFQLNGQGMTHFLKELKPTDIHDINAMVALYRPGPMEFIPEYIKRKHNPEEVDYPHELLKEDLEKSYGLLIYQEDVMMTAIKLAGYSWLEADKFRKAMGKKIPELMAKQEEKFKSGCIENGIKEELAEDLWERIKPFAAYAFNKCVTGDTLLTDAKTGERISVKDLYESSLTPHLHSITERGLFESHPVSSVSENGVKEAYELVTRTGRTIKATSNHPLLTFGGWKELGSLTEGDRIAVPRRIPTPSESKELEEYKVATLGYLLAEGNFCHPHGNYFYSKNKMELDDFRRCAEQFENCNITSVDRGHATTLYLGQIDPKNGNTLDVWIQEIGLKWKKAREKFVPEICFELSNKQLALLLGKMWQGDGAVSIENSQVFYATSSQQMARDVQHILLRLGILNTIHTKQFKYRGGYKEGYTIVVSHRDNIIRFNSLVGIHFVGKKREQMKELAEKSREYKESLGSSLARSSTRDTIPAAVLSTMREEMETNSYTPVMIERGCGVSSRLLHRGQKKKGYQRSTILKIATFLESENLSDIASSDIHWDEVVSIQQVGKKMTYDITIPPHHNFVANDIVVHNSHSASYGHVAYQTAYFKANYPIEYMASILTADSGDVDKIAEAVNECKRMGIEILPPDINESFGTFTIVEPEGEGNEAIRFGLYTIKNFGEGIADAIIEERKEHGPYESLANFLDRVHDRNLNRKSLESLIKCGALDAFGERGEMTANIEGLLEYNKEQSKVQNQDSLFGGMEDEIISTLTLKPTEPASKEEKLGWEKELLGLYISGHPLDKHREKLEGRKYTIEKIKETLNPGMVAVAAGIIEDVKPIITKRGDKMAFVRIADFTDSLEIVVFPNTFKSFEDILTPESCVAIKGKMSDRNNEKSLIAEAVKEM